MVGVTGRLLLCSLLLSIPVAPAGAAATIGIAPPSPEADTTATRIEVAADGSATWTLQIRTRLTTDQQVEEYRAFQRRFRENTSRYLDPFRDSIRGVVSNAANATGRSMRANEFSASTSIQQVPRRWGVVTYEFRWTNFAVQQGDRLTVSDVFQGGFFIAENDSLELVAPDGYRVDSVDPEPDERGDGVVSWTGREDFADARPRIVFEPAPDAASQPSTGTPTAGDGLGAVEYLAAGVLLLGGFAAVATVAYRRWIVDGATGEPNEEQPADRERVAAGGEQAVSVEELLTDEDEVRHLLESHGGRMRQKSIGDELDWSKSKVSRVLSRMAEEGVIEKLRIGRENVIELSEEAEQ